MTSVKLSLIVRILSVLYQFCKLPVMPQKNKQREGGRFLQYEYLPILVIPLKGLCSSVQLIPYQIIKQQAHKKDNKQIFFIVCTTLTAIQLSPSSDTLTF